MLALLYLDQMLSTFRPLFTRHLPWTMFYAVILGLIGSHHVEASPRSVASGTWMRQAITNSSTFSMLLPGVSLR